MKLRISVVLLLLSFTILLTGCPNAKPASDTQGSYSGTASNSSSSYNLTVNIDTKDNPVSGSYKMMGDTVNVNGTINGSFLGTILSFTLKPGNASGTTYTLDGTMDDNNAGLTGKMTGREKGVLVTYNVDLKRK